MRRRLSLATVLFVAASLVAVVVPTARAAVTATKLGVNVSVLGDATLDDIIIRRSGTQILVFNNGAAVPITGGPATVTNTDSIIIGTGDNLDNVTIDLSGGPFAPGESPENFPFPSPPEIEISVTPGLGVPDNLSIVGSNGPDRIEVVSSFVTVGFNLNGDDDADVSTTIGFGNVVVSGRGGNDRIGLDADFLLGSCLGSGTVLSFADGGAGNDTISGNAVSSPSVLLGGSGKDTLTPSVCDSFIDVTPATMSGGPGNDTVIGGDQADTLTGGKGKDNLFGGGLADTLNGGRGRDRCNGGADTDVLTSCERATQ